MLENITAIKAVKALRVLGLPMHQAVSVLTCARDYGPHTFMGIRVEMSEDRRFSITDPVLGDDDERLYRREQES